MTTIDTHAGARVGASQPNLVARLGAWVISSDHKKTGRLLIGEALVASVVAAVIGAMLGLERMSSGYGIFHGDATPQLVALFRYLLAFGVLAPATLGLALAVVPMQVGSRAVSFPRLAQFGFWAWDLGSVVVIVSIIGTSSVVGMR